MSTCVILHSCDKYHYILDEFFEHFEEHFPYKDFTVYHITETKRYNRPYTHNISIESGSWSERFTLALKEIPEDNFVYLQEDMIILNVDGPAVMGCVALHEMNLKNNFYITKMGAFHDFRLSCTDYYLLDKYPVWIQVEGSYVMSHQPPAIFNKEFFAQTLQREHDVWTHECEVSDEINAEKYGQVNVFCVGNVFYPVNKSEIITSHHAIRKGVYVGLNNSYTRPT